jgi:hypothetical protein
MYRGVASNCNWRFPKAQRVAIEAFARQHGGAIAASFVEVKTGKRSDRPELAKALEAARKGKATLLQNGPRRYRFRSGYYLGRRGLRKGDDYCVL